MKRVLAIILLMAAFAPLANAQIPDDPTSVEIGWDSDTEPMIMELDSNHNFELLIKFWVENSRLTPTDVEFEVEIYESFMVDDPGKVTVAANSNETFELKISGIGIDGEGSLFPSTDIFQVVLKADILLGEQSTGTAEIEKEIKFSKVYGFDIDFQPLYNGKGPEVKSGSDKNMEIVIELAGNTPDSVLKTDLSFRGCPQMNYLEEESMFPGVIESGQKYLGAVTLVAPSSHPDKICTFVVAVTSEGNGISYTAEVEFVVEAPDVKLDDEDEEESTTESTDFEVKDSSLPAISSLLCLLTVVLAAVIRRN